MRVLRPHSGLKEEGKKIRGASAPAELKVIDMGFPKLEVKEGLIVIDDYDVEFAGSPEALSLNAFEGSTRAFGDR